MDRNEITLLINLVIQSAGRKEPRQILADSDFSKDLEFDSLDYAELGIRLEDKYGWDVFAKALPQTVGDLYNLLQPHRK